MSGSLTLEICSPRFSPVTHEAEEAILPGQAGILTVLPGHTALLTTLGYGVVVVRETQETSHFYAVHGGFAEVMNNRIRILADEVEPADKIDADAARADLERAIEGLRKPGQFPSLAEAERLALKSRARLQAAAREAF